MASRFGIPLLEGAISWYFRREGRRKEGRKSSGLALALALGCPKVALSGETGWLAGSRHAGYLTQTENGGGKRERERETHMTGCWNRIVAGNVNHLANKTNAHLILL